MANTSKFSTEQVFGSREELMTWVQNVACSQGFVIVTKRSRPSRVGYIAKIVLACDRGGVSRSKDAKTKKYNCPFELVGKYLKAHNGWTLRVVCDSHNHDPAMCMEGHPYAMRLSGDESRMVEQLTRLNVKPRDILSTLKERNKNNASSLKTIYRARDKFRMSEQEDRTPMQNVMHILQTKGYDFEYRLNDISNQLEELFFIHPTSLKTWQAFPYVVFMDATYKTNKYNLPFLEIVGVTSTNKTFSIAFAFMHNEKTSNYTWALTCLKLTINGSFCPRVIVTDRDMALMKACEEVFPQSNHLLCRWHIFMDLNEDPPRHSSFFMDLNEEPPRHNSFFMNLNEIPHEGHNSLLKQIPEIFHPYITNIQDVRGDGNCGFRAIAACLGYGEDQWLSIRHELLDELVSSYSIYSSVFYGIDEIFTSLSFRESPAPEQHWMLMPETGILIANRFGVILQYLAIGGSMTCFPLWKGPEEFQYHRVFTISHVNGNHYVMVQLEGEYPMPPISGLWTRKKTPLASGWETMYKSRLEFYKKLKPTERSFLNIED